MTEFSKKLTGIPFRAGFLFTLLYLIFLAIGAFMFYVNMHGKLLGQIDRQLLQRYENIHTVYEVKGMDAVTKELGLTPSDALKQRDFNFRVTGADGETLLGNIAGFEQRNGHYEADAEVSGSGDTEGYRFYTDKLGDNNLTIGLNDQTLHNLRGSVVSSFLLTFFFTTLLVLPVAMLLASRSRARVRSMAQSMKVVGNGNLSERLSISHRDDDIDQLSGEINNALVLLQKQSIGMEKVSTNIAHDLKTPLNRLNIKIEEAIGLVDPDAPVLEKLEAASEESRHINETFELLLRITQIEAGACKASFTETDINSVLRKAYEVYEVVAEENQQQISIDLHEDTLAVMGDEGLLLQLVVNLIENAIRHCPSQANIAVSAGLLDNSPWIKICDTGPGIPQGDRERVFERLFRLEDSRTSKGTGLGLSLVKAIVNVHNGSISLTDNEPGLCVKILFKANH